MNCPKCGEEMKYEDGDSRQEWKTESYFCKTCNKTRTLRTEYRAQSSIVEREGWDEDTEEAYIKDRLAYLRGEIVAERISMGEIIELQDLVDHIEPGDVQLLEWAGVPEADAYGPVSERKSTYISIIGEHTAHRDFDRVSTLEIEKQQKTMLYVMGNLPHGYRFRPKTAADRDCLVEWLSTLEYDETSIVENVQSKEREG